MLASSAGVWIKDTNRSDQAAYGRALDLMQLNGLQKTTALRLIEGVEIQQDSSNFSVNFLTVVPFFKVHRTAPLHHESSVQWFCRKSSAGRFHPCRHVSLPSGGRHDPHGFATVAAHSLLIMQPSCGRSLSSTASQGRLQWAGETYALGSRLPRQCWIRKGCGSASPGGSPEQVWTCHRRSCGTVSMLCCQQVSCVLRFVFLPVSNNTPSTDCISRGKTAACPTYI